MQINDLKDLTLDSAAMPTSMAKRDKRINNYLRENSTVFQELDDLRIEGWNTPSGDAFFAKQRKDADEASPKQRQMFFRLMQAIGDEIQNKTGTLRISHEYPIVLDLCMAPGGYTKSALKYNERARVFGITLPTKLGGHPLLLNKDDLLRVTVLFTDITLCAAEFSIQEIPSDHPDRDNFSLDSRPHAGIVADLVICDGQVLRTHAEHRETYRERSEAARLTHSQLVLALQRIRHGGTLIMLLHMADRFDTMALLRDFDRFADVQLFKPQRGHRKRSSFYLIATNVRPEDAAAVAAKRRWIGAWTAATFGAEQTDDGDGDAGAASVAGENGEGNGQETWAETEEMLAEFGDRLIALAEPIWRTQAVALKKAPWFRDSAAGPKKGRVPS